MNDNKRSIVEKATILFSLNGLHSVSMYDVAFYSGISKKTLYGYFESKEDLVEAVVGKLILKTGKYLRVSPEISPNAVKEIVNFTEHMSGVLEILTPKFIRDLKKYYPVIYVRLIAFRDNSLRPYFDRLLTRGIAEEVFRPEINEGNAGRLYCWQIQNVLEGESQGDVMKMIEISNDLFLHGILHPKGLKLYSVNKET